MIKVEVKSQIIDYLKKNWKELLIVALLFFFYIKGRMDYSSLYNLHIETTQSYEKRIEDLNKAHEERIRKKGKSYRKSAFFWFGVQEFLTFLIGFWGP